MYSRDGHARTVVGPGNTGLDKKDEVPILKFAFQIGEKREGDQL